MADVPAWYWQVLGAICGLGLGLVLGALHKRRNSKGNAANAPRAQTVGPSSTVPLPARPSRPPGATGLPSAATAAQPAAAEAGPSQRLLEKLRETNLDLNAKLRASTDQHARDILERSQAQQSDQMRHERQLEELRQAHSSELSHLMTAMVEQVDAMQREHAAQVHTLEGEIERLKRASQTSAEAAASEALTRPVTMTMGGDMRPLPAAPPGPPTRPRSSSH
ncbi:MAG TPA: hypothetical protein VLA61_27220 [Ideonella sp.]|uniref:hypothetical protein n=1 Tax=Ideonella sp. TaxID=1929293 RepID=UPI002CD1D27D|nr:hypothetical protein [Ideonella sp.]HSI51973.1 hypothetical protein [Ideonella sp.]